jgi:hypothetical protein
VGYDNVAPDQLLANPKNFRVHPRHQQDALKGVLSEVGWVQDVIVNVRTNTVVDGHLRVMLALRHNEPTIPVKYVDLSQAEEDLVLATLDPIAALAGTDSAKLSELLDTVSAQDEALLTMLADLSDDTELEAQILAPQPTEAAFADNPWQERADEVERGERPPIRMQMMQLYLTPELHAEVVEILKRLAGTFGTGNVTDTIVEAIRYAGRQ